MNPLDSSSPYHKGLFLSSQSSLLFAEREDVVEESALPASWLEVASQHAGSHKWVSIFLLATQASSGTQEACVHVQAPN